MCEKREDKIRRLGEFDRYRIHTFESNFNNFPIVSWENDTNISCPLGGTLGCPAWIFQLQAIPRMDIFLPSPFVSPNKYLLEIFSIFLRDT